MHWYDQHRSGGTPSQLASGKTAHTPVDEVVRHTTTDTGRQLKAGNSMFKSHDAMLELYDAVKANHIDWDLEKIKEVKEEDLGAGGVEKAKAWS